MDDRFGELVLWIYDNRKIFNSKQYLDVMTIIQKASKMTTVEKQLQLNDYRLHEDDDNISEDDGVEYFIETSSDETDTDCDDTSHY